MTVAVRGHLQATPAAESHPCHQPARRFSPGSRLSSRSCFLEREVAEASLVSVDDPHSEGPGLWGPYGHTHTHDSLLTAQQFRAR